MTATSPTLRFLLRHPAHFIALGFGSGLAPFAPGTFGTLVAIPIAALLRAYASDAGFVAAIVLLFALGTWAAIQVSNHRSRTSKPALPFPRSRINILILRLLQAVT